MTVILLRSGFLLTLVFGGAQAGRESVCKAGANAFGSMFGTSDLEPGLGLGMTKADAASSIARSGEFSERRRLEAPISKNGREKVDDKKSEALAEDTLDQGNEIEGTTSPAPVQINKHVEATAHQAKPPMGVLQQAANFTDVSDEAGAAQEILSSDSAAADWFFLTKKLASAQVEFPQQSAKQALDVTNEKSRAEDQNLLFHKQHLLRSNDQDMEAGTSATALASESDAFAEDGRIGSQKNQLSLAGLGQMTRMVSAAQELSAGVAQEPSPSTVLMVVLFKCESGSDPCKPEWLKVGEDYAYVTLANDAPLQAVSVAPNSNWSGPAVADIKAHAVSNKYYTDKSGKFQPLDKTVIESTPIRDLGLPIDNNGQIRNVYKVYAVWT